MGKLWNYVNILFHIHCAPINIETSWSIKQGEVQINLCFVGGVSTCEKSMTSINIVLALHILPLQHLSIAKLFLAETKDKGTER